MSTIRSNFKNLLSARKALIALKDAGFPGAHLDLPQSFDTEFSNDINFSVGTHAQSLSSLVLRSDSYSKSPGKGALAVSDPMVSGLGSSREIMDNLGTSLIVKASDEDIEKAKEIISAHGGAI